MMKPTGPQARSLQSGAPPKTESDSPAAPVAHAGRSRVVDQPDVGFFLIRRVRKGPWVPARICRDFGHWWAEIDGKPAGRKSEDPITADQVLSIWHHGREITREEYYRRLNLPQSERPDPFKPVDLRKKDPIF